MLLMCLLGAISLVLTVVLYAAFPLSPWWILPVAIGAFIAVSILFILLLLLFSLFLPTQQPQSHKPFCHRILRHLIHWVLLLLGFRVTVSGEEQLPAQPFLLVGNHRSNYDPIVTLAALNVGTLSFVSKPENFRIPLVGRLIRCASFLAIDRESARHAMQTIHTAADYIDKRHICMGIYPEGTRSKTGKLLDFRNGAFKIAKLAHCPIVVMTVQYPKRRRAQLRVVDVIDVPFVESNRTNVLSDRARDAILNDLAQH